MAFASFMASTAGRAVRIIAGLALVALGIFLIGSTVGWIIAVVGLLPIAAGVFDFCLFAPLFGAPFMGKQVRSR
ncbi:MAG: DUF2892 domain-containing protein [Chloroflexi bacterium]|uniref:DUF2892 domain-containing protein n=1 Tax=Candidatus Chlorohelix allophototropha TaxID=3003348 RepID=A0A8T7M4I6_9CHLR|nr:DUF2892 domain-containing protein [Chloroflexota bacterium]WJW70006.1 DUF2892 domain-containing protein [Chloroflexota bacterium L227-S17]